MNQILDLDLCVRVALTLGHFLWQGAVAAVSLLILNVVLRRATSQTRYLVSVSVLILMAVSPLVTFTFVTGHHTNAGQAPTISAAVRDSNETNWRAEGRQPPDNDRSENSPRPNDLRLAGIQQRLPATPANNGSPPIDTTRSTIDASALSQPTENSTAWARVAPWIVAAYVIGVGVLLLRLLIALWGGRALRKRATPIRGDALADSAERIARALGLRLAPVMAWCDEVAVPTVIGVLRPTILLPLSLTSGLAPEQVEAVLAHELGHIKCFDHLVNVLQRVIESLLFFHPAVWWVSSRIRIEREHACDDLAVSLGTPRLAYANSLLRVAELSRLASSLGAGLRAPPSAKVSLLATDGKPSKLRQRIARLLGESSEPQVRLRPVSLVAVIVLLLSGSLFAAKLALTDESTSQSSRAAESGAPQESQKPLDGVKLNPGMEEKLQWGEAVNGLRAAIVRPPALGLPEAGELLDFHLVVQNVSEAPIRFSTTSAAANNPGLKFRKDDRTLGIINADKPVPVDVVLQPREVVVLPMFENGGVKGQSMAGESQGSLTFSATLKIESAPAGAWTGTLVTAETSEMFIAHGLKLKDKDAQALLKLWNAKARKDGKIPGALIGELAESIRTFTKYNPTWKTTPQLLEMLPRFDATHDWPGQDVVALLDELATLQASPISMLSFKEYGRAIRTGTPLPRELANAPWGEPLPNGLRMAWLLEPRALKYRLGTPLKSLILIHNAGKNAVVFRTQDWHQFSEHKASDANGKDINVDSTYWTRLSHLVQIRLAPGEFVEVDAAGIGIGADKKIENWQGTRVGSWIHAKEGDEVTFKPAAVPLGEANKVPPRDDESKWWLQFIEARLSRDLPLPDDADERTRLLDRAVRDLFGTGPTPDEIATFVADREPTEPKEVLARRNTVIGALAKRLSQRPGLTPFSGSLQSGTKKFLVLPPDPDAVNRPRVANNPGWYTLGDHVRFSVTRRPLGERIVNEASIVFFSADQKSDPPGKPHEVKLPDGYNTWAAAWERGSTVLWVTQKGIVHSYDFANPAQIKETQFAESEFDRIPKPILEALRAEFDVPGAPKQVQEPLQEASGAEKNATNDVHVRFAEKSEQVAKAEYEKILDANRRVPGAVPEVEVLRAKLTWELWQLRVEEAKAQRARQDDPDLRVRVAMRAAELAKVEDEKILEMNRRVPGTVSKVDVELAKLKYEKALLVTEQAEHQVMLRRFARELAVKQAIERGVSFLKAQQQESGTWMASAQPDGVTALCAAALLQAGAKADEESIQKSLTRLRKIEPTFIYTVALQTMVFCAASPKQDAELIRRNLAWMENAQVPQSESRGGWDYNDVRVGGNGSCTRFAILALHTAKKAGFAVKDGIWRRAGENWLRNQSDDGGWGYAPGGKSSLTMTLAGIAGLSIVNQHLPQDEQTKARDAAILKSHGFLRANIAAIKTSPWTFYAVHCLERAGHLSGKARLGELDWQAHFAKWLLDHQRPDGSWIGSGANPTENELIATSLALLSLSGHDESGK